MMEIRISQDEGAPQEAIDEAIRRSTRDGIPRHVHLSGRIMKWDWELPEDALQGDLAGEALEEHIRTLIGNQGR